MQTTSKSASTAVHVAIYASGLDCIGMRAIITHLVQPHLKGTWPDDAPRNGIVFLFGPLHVHVHAWLQPTCTRPLGQQLPSTPDLKYDT